MHFVRFIVRHLYGRAEALLGLAFPAHWNPLLNLGALGFFFYWIITVTGIYLFIFFDTGVHAAYDSVEYITNEQWYLAGVTRSLHRYASDGLVVVMLLHILREFGLDRYRGARWLSWATGGPVLVMVYIAGITGYWLVWDRLAQYVAIVSTEWLDRLPIFGEPIARNFLSPETVDSRFFTLMIFMHIAVPLFALGILWLHLARIAKPRINPPRGLAIGAFGSLLILSLVHPAVSQGPADLARVPGNIGLDWFYLPLYPLFETWPGPVSWGAGLALLAIMAAMPWMPPMRRPSVAAVDLANCNGCARCYDDCPYVAIEMVSRRDSLPFERQPVVDPARCVSCGICAGACPTSMPFRRLSELSPGIDLPDLSMARLRDALEDAAAGLVGPARILVFGCGEGVPLDLVRSSNVGIVKLACVGQLPPAFIDYVLSRNFADGVVLTGCAPNSCHARSGIRLTEARLAGERDPRLRARVPRERVRTVWAGRIGGSALRREVTDFAMVLTGLGPVEIRTRASRREKVDA